MTQPQKTRLALRVHANASRSGVIGWQGRKLRIRVASPPVDGRGNAAVVDTLAKALGVRKSCVTMVRGFASRDKVVEVAGMCDAEVRSRLQGVRFGGVAETPGT